MDFFDNKIPVWPLLWNSVLETFIYMGAVPEGFIENTFSQKKGRICPQNIVQMLCAF